MKKLASVVSAPFEWDPSGSHGIPKLYYLAAALLPGGLVALPILWWLDRRRINQGKS